MTDKKWEDANAISKDDVVLYLLKIREHANGLIADARAASAAALQESLERNCIAIFTPVDALRSSSFTRDSWKTHIDDFDRQCVYALLRDRRSSYESKLAGTKAGLRFLDEHVMRLVVEQTSETEMRG